MPQILAVNYQWSIIFFALLNYLLLFINSSLNVGNLEIIFGVYSYLILGFFFFFLMDFFQKKGQILILVIFYIYTLINNEHVLVNNSNLDLSFIKYVKHKSLFTSIFNHNFSATLLFVTTLLFTSMLISRKVPSIIKLSKPARFLLLVYLFIFDLFIDRNIAIPSWVQQNPLSASLVIQNRIPLKAKSKLVQPEVNLEGEKLIDLNLSKKPNIVILLLEGFSQLYVESGIAPELKKIQEESFYLKNFITNQMQTNRGLYSFFCGDYPNLITAIAKSDLFSSDLISRECFPHILKKIGYKNYFFQSAPLDFMRKDLFAKKAGFDFAVGAGSFDKNKLISNWGIGDNILLQAIYKIIIEQIQSLKNKNKPILISGLTVGTHHPYITPVSKGDLVQAIRYTDSIVGEFYRTLKEKNILENTILIITSDESKLFSSNFPLIYGNWGLFMASGSGIKKGISEQIFSQYDVSISLMDLLGESERNRFKGRSLFRKYSNDRSIYAGNIYAKRVFKINSINDYIICDYSLNCNQITNDLGIFSQERQALAVNKKTYQADLHDFVSQNDIDYNKLKSSLLFKDEELKLESKKEYIIMQEFKFIPKENETFSIELFLDRKAKTNEMKIVFSYYICGEPDSLKNEIRELGQEKEYYRFKFKVNEKYLKKTLCLASGIQTNSLNRIPLKKFFLRLI